MESWKTLAKNEFDRWSASYNQSILQRIFFGPSHRKVLENVYVPPDAAVLDVGCGTGLFASKVLDANPNAHVTGLDLSVGMLEKAESLKKIYPGRFTAVHGDSEHLPFDDGSFDVVTCIHSFHHYPNQIKVLREMHRVLRPNGELVIVDADRDWWWGWLVFDVVVATIEGGVHHCSRDEFHRFFSVMGFVNVRQTRSGWLAPFLMNIVRVDKTVFIMPHRSAA